MYTRLKTIEYDYNEVGEEALTPSQLIYGRRIKTLADEVAEPDDAINIDNCSARFKYPRQK